MGKKESNNQMAEWRKKHKQRQKKQLADKRQEDFEAKFKERGYDDVNEEIGKLKELKADEKITFEQEHKLARLEKYTALHAPELKKRQREVTQTSLEQRVAEALAKKKRVAKFSVYYHEWDNPFGICPPGEQPKFRWPDGSIQRNPPVAQDEAVDEKRRKLEQRVVNIPGFTDGAIAKISLDARLAEEKDAKERAARGLPVKKNVDEEPALLYIPPLPVEPYPGYVPAPLPEASPPFSNIQDFYDVVTVLKQLREEILAKKRAEFEEDRKQWLQRREERMAAKGKGKAMINNPESGDTPDQQNPTTEKKDTDDPENNRDSTNSAASSKDRDSSKGPSKPKAANSTAFLSQMFAAKKSSATSAANAAYAKATMKIGKSANAIANVDKQETIAVDTPMVPGFGDEEEDWEDEEEGDYVDPARQKELERILDEI